MVKNKNDKTKLSDWEDGDVFALKIESEECPEYNNRYIIFIHCIIQKEEWKMSRTIKTFKAKITKDNKLPTTKEEIENLEYIKTGFYKYKLEKIKFRKDVKNLIPDKYHFIYSYLFQVKPFKYKIPENLIFLGNFQITPPINEYIPNSPYNRILFTFWKHKYGNVIDDLLKFYEAYNLQKVEIYCKEYQDNFENYEREEIRFYKYMEKLGKVLEGPHGKEIIKAMGIDIENEKRTNNSITYVGGNQKKQKNK